MDQKLEKLYRLQWPALRAGIPRGLALSNPLLATVPYAYEHAKTRLLVVGQETHGWWGLWDEQNSPDPILTLRGYYCVFARGRNQNSPFFHASRFLQQELNPDADPHGFMWLNLFMCDQRNSTPTEPAAEALRKLSMLRTEIAILDPHAIVFFTGGSRSAYNYTLAHERYFPNAKFESVDPASNLWSAMQVDGIRAKMVRSYHPNYLWRSKNRSVLKQIANWLKEPLNAGS
jgi:uracil-DNA glycosylase